MEFYNEINVDKEVNYYNPSDFQKFNQLHSFPEYNNNVDKINKNSTPESKYSTQDYDEFNKIIPKIDIDQKKIDNQNKKLRIIKNKKKKINEKKIKKNFKK